MRKFVSTLIRRICALSLLVCLGCAAQSNAPDLNKRIEDQIRSYYSVAPEVNIAVGPRHPSPEFSGYDAVNVAFTSGDKKQEKEFLVSKDGKTLIRVVKMDLTKDPYTEVMSKIDIAGRPVRGNKDAKVTIVNFDDFQCPYCARMHATLTDEIMKLYGDKIKLVYKDYPLEEIHPWAMHAAVDANCLAAQNQQAYWNFADAIHTGGRQLTQGKPMPQQFAAIDKLTLDEGQRNNDNMAQLESCVKAQKQDTVKASMKEAEALSVEATPTLFINGRKIDGAVPVEDLRAVIDRALIDVGEKPPTASALPSGGGN